MFLSNHSTHLKKKLYEKYGEEAIKTKMPESFSLRKVIENQDESNKNEVKLTRLQIQLNEAEEKVKKRKLEFERNRKIIEARKLKAIENEK